MTDNVTFECVVSADLFARAQLGVSTEGSRYYLNGVHVSPAPEGGAVLTATDGSLLICFHDPDAYVSGEAIVMLDKPMLRALPVSGILLEKRLLLVRASEGGRNKAFVVDQPTSKQDDEPQVVKARSVFDDPDKRVKAAQFSPCIIDGKFPDWRRVLPDALDPAAPVPPFDSGRLARITRALCWGKNQQITITPSKDANNGPFVVTANDALGLAGFGILMPLRSERKADFAIPAWAKVPAALEAA